MAFKPNYNQQRAERDRAKQAKKDAKLRERDEAANRRRAGDDSSAEPEMTPQEDADQPPASPGTPT